MVAFCTFFDSNYLGRGLTLYRSLEQHCTDFHLWILCLDQNCYEFFQAGEFQHITPVSLSDFESGNTELARAKSNRSTIEYYFTCTPCFTEYVIQNNEEIELITYLDADLYFYNDPAPIFEELAHASVGIIEHRFPGRMKKLERYGIFNVAWVSFRRDRDGLACLHRWSEQCMDWCYDKLEDDRFADQKYLDSWPEDFNGVCVIQHKGANLAPWNVANYRITTQANTVMVDEQALLFFHFHGLKQVAPWPVYNTSLGENRTILTAVLRNDVYRPYLQAQFETQQQWLQHAGEGVELGGVRDFVNGLWRSESLRSVSRGLVSIYSLLVCRAYMIFRGR